MKYKNERRMPHFLKPAIALNKRKTLNIRHITCALWIIMTINNDVVDFNKSWRIRRTLKSIPTFLLDACAMR